MYFANDELIRTLARERQQRLIHDAANRRLIRLTKEARPAAKDWRRLFRHAPAISANGPLLRRPRTSPPSSAAQREPAERFKAIPFR
jgi:hypothetical protein